MADPLAELLAVRRRLRASQQAFAEARACLQRGEPQDLQLLNIQLSELRALEALARALARRLGGGRTGDA
jgi:hypothetical protein